MQAQAYAVIGSNYGDESKGHITDYICSKHSPDFVIRFNGGSQAGHSVVTPKGERNVFHHHASGGFLNIPTYLSEHFICNPILFFNELQLSPTHVHPSSTVTTPLDMLINQAIAKLDTCGVGIFETVLRSRDPKYCIKVKTIRDKSVYDRILKEYIPKRLLNLNLFNLEFEAKWREIYFSYVEKFLDKIIISEKPKGTNFVFEGAQGLMLDQNYPGFPYLTPSNTGIKNVLELCNEWDIKELNPIYVSRSYLTRHGAGPLVNEQPLPNWVKDETNFENKFQGKLRYAPLNIKELEQRIIKDHNNSTSSYKIAITCLDQKKVEDNYFLKFNYRSYGPKRNDVECLLAP